MKWDHIIRGGEIVTPASIYQANVYIKDGKIAAITNETLEGEAKVVTDAMGLYVLPGLIDTHVHSRDGGATYKEDFYHSTQAAAAGGVTTVFEMPNTNPTINEPDNFYAQVENLQAKAHVNFGIWGICLGDINRDQLLPLSKAGVIGFKYFWGYAIEKDTFQLVYNFADHVDHVFPPCDDGEVFAMFQEVAKTEQTFAIHAENSEVIHRLTKEYEKKGEKDYDSFLSSRPNFVEQLTIQTAITMAKATGAKLHILHVSTKEGVDLIRQAQAEGITITAETCPHYLFLTNEDFEKIGPTMKVYPLVKYQKDQNALWEGIHDGTISIVCSDHAPHTEEEKRGALDEIPAGMCGVETMVPLMLDAVTKGKLTLQQFVTLLAENPAKQFGVYPKKGTLQVGADADITIIDMDKKAEIKKENLHSKSKVTAYDGFSITGMPVITIVNGTVVMKNGETLTRAGQLVTPTA